MSEQEAQQRIGKMLEDFIAVKQKVHILQEEARQTAKVLEVMVEFLASGGERGKISMGMPPETYFTERVSRLFADLSEKKQLKNSLLGIGVTVD